MRPVHILPNFLPELLIAGSIPARVNEKKDVIGALRFARGGTRVGPPFGVIFRSWGAGLNAQQQVQE